MIIGYLGLALGAFILASVILIGRKKLHQLAISSVALLNVMLTQADEDTHIKNVEQATTKLMVALLKTLGLFVMALFAAALPMVILYLLNQEVYQQLSLRSFYSIAAISIGATLPFLLPIKKSSNGSYSELQQLLHHLILDNFEIGKKLFQRESKTYATAPTHDIHQFIIVSGLARAGTTSLMNKLASVDMFATLNYANMPLLMAPNLWSKVYKAKASETTERSHKDGIQIGLNSNEALEEYFFKAITNDRFISENSIHIHELSENEYHEYLTYQNVIRKNSGQFYLAKNNNFLLRYKGIRALNDVFVMIIIFRSPLTHALSLLEKHRSFSKLQKEDPFVLDYMNWLGHHEFGLNHIPFEFETESTRSDLSTDSIDYWLQAWINYYEYAIHSKHRNTVFICYEKYCENPNEVVNTILGKLGKPSSSMPESPFINQREATTDCNKTLLAKADKLYTDLLELA